MKNNADIIAFCRATGLRRRELEAVRGTALIYKHGEAYIEVFNGKGGKYRAVPVINDIEAVERLCRAAGSGRIFSKVPAAMDVHSYRAQYATDLYKMHARPFEVCKATPFYDPQKKRSYQNSLYYFRRDRAGEWLDRAAMLQTSQALGHNRICVVGEHYIML